MSTRSFTIFEGRKARIQLYRHCDGYPAGAGDTLQQAIQGKGETLSTIAQRLLDTRYDLTPTSPEPRRIYELADWGADTQGDLEYVYVVRQNARLGILIDVHERANWQHDSYRKWPKRRFTLAAFRIFVQQEQAEIEKRIAARAQA